MARLRMKQYILGGLIIFIGILSIIYYIFNSLEINVLNSLASNTIVKQVSEKNLKEQGGTDENVEIDLLSNNNSKKNDIKQLINIKKEQKKINNTIENNKKENFNKVKNNNKIKSKKNIYIAINTLKKDKIEILNKYISKAKLIIGDKYNINIITSKKIDRTKACLYSYNEKLFHKKIGPFQRNTNILYSEVIRYFNKHKINSDDKLIIFNQNNLDINCNSIDNIKRDIKTLKSNNSNIIVFDYIGSKKIEKDFFNQLSRYTGITNIKYDNGIDFRNKLNDYIYPIENKLELTNHNKDSNNKINTLISIYDKDNNEYQAELTIFKKQGSLFKPIKKETVKKVYQNRLDAGIYKFLGYDPITKIYLETDPIVINKLNKFEYKFIFRKTKLIINLLDENKKPILGDIRIKGIERKDIYINKLDNKSHVILYVKPGKYLLQIKTKNNFIFKEEFNINGESDIVKTYTTIKQKVKIHVVDQDNKPLYNNLITIHKDDVLYDTKKGNDIIFKLQLGKYNIKVIDANSGNLITKYLEINHVSEDINNIKLIKLQIIGYPVYVKLSKKGYILKLYNTKALNRPLKRISGTGTKILNLSEGNYLFKVYDIKNQFLFNQRFTVDNFLRNEVIIKEKE